MRRFKSIIGVGLISCMILSGCTNSGGDNTATPSVASGNNELTADELSAVNGAQGLIDRMYESGAYFQLITDTNTDGDILFIYNKNKSAYAETSAGCPIYFDNKGNARIFEIPYRDIKDVSPLMLSEVALNMAKAGSADVSTRVINGEELYNDVLEQVKDYRASESTEVDTETLGVEGETQESSSASESASEESTSEESTSEESTAEESTSEESTESVEETSESVEETLSVEDEAESIVGFTLDEAKDYNYNDTSVIITGRDNIIKLYEQVFNSESATEYVNDIFTGDDNTADDEYEFIYHVGPEDKVAGIMLKMRNDPATEYIGWYFDGYFGIGGDWETPPDNWFEVEDDSDKVKETMTKVVDNIGKNLKAFQEDHFTEEQLIEMNEAYNESVEETLAEESTEAVEDEINSIVKNGSFKETIDGLLKKDGLTDISTDNFIIPEGYTDTDKARMVDIYNKLLEWDAVQQDGTLISPISPDEVEFANGYIKACEEAFKKDTTSNAESTDKYGTTYWKDTVGIFIGAIQ